MANILAEIVSALLLFCLVYGMSATVEISHIRKQVSNSKALLIGIGLQFVILPFVGFVVVKAFRLPAEIGIILLVITSSPGGSYSNLWCSMFNADLALSVTMTAFSTFLSTFMLPTNLILYTHWTYSAAVVKSLDWGALFVSLVVVIGGITAGLTTSYCTGNSIQMHRRANRMGNLAGLALIVLSVTVSSSNQQAALWDQHASFYVACALPHMIGLILAVALATRFKLEKPERVAVTVEGSYQNTGIATTVALTMFQTERELATAIGVPLYYGIVEAACILCFCIISWKVGWTKAPASGVSLCKVITTSYEVEAMATPEEEISAIEVILSEANEKNNTMLIFSCSNHGDYVIDAESLQINEHCDDHDTENSGDEDGHDGEMDVVHGLPKEKSAATELDVCTTSDTTTMYTKNGRIRRTIASLRARAIGYRPQAPLNAEVDENDDNENDVTRTYPPTETVMDQEVPNPSSSAVSRVAVSVASRARRNYSTLDTNIPIPESSCDEEILHDDSLRNDDDACDISL